MAIPAGDNYDKKRENNKKKERLVVKCGGKVGNYAAGMKYCIQKSGTDGRHSPDYMYIDCTVLDTA